MKPWQVHSNHGDVLAELGAGSWFGEMALVDDGPASAKVRSATALAVLSIEHDDFSHLLETHPNLAAGFYRHFAGELARRLRAANERQP
jgi:CRP-like cAMP-binding protein